ncbi:hypothetical protein D3C84_809310 [compost metagenome]
MSTVQTTSVCWVPQRLWDGMTALASEWRPLEVGGVMAGYWNGNSAVITEYVGPGDEATHSPTAFVPDHQFHVREIERIYAESNGRDVYLGDWHSHPSGPTALSRLDKRTLRTIAKDPDAQCLRPMMLLAEDNISWSLHAFTLDDSRWLRPRKVVPMHVRVF